MLFLLDASNWNWHTQFFDRWLVDESKYPEQPPNWFRIVKSYYELKYPQRMEIGAKELLERVSSICFGVEIQRGDLEKIKRVFMKPIVCCLESFYQSLMNRSIWMNRRWTMSCIVVPIVKPYSDAMPQSHGELLSPGHGLLINDPTKCLLQRTMNKIFIAITSSLSKLFQFIIKRKADENCPKCC